MLWTEVTPGHPQAALSLEKALDAEQTGARMTAYGTLRRLKSSVLQKGKGLAASLADPG